MNNGDGTSPEFERYASSYDALLDDPARNRFARDPLHFHRRKWEVLRSLLEREGMIPKTLRWLDVGCGRGELLELAGSHFAKAVGCDPSAGMLSTNTSFRKYEQPSLTKLPFEDASLDIVTAVCVFHHVHGNDRDLLMQEIRRVLARNGLFCMIEHNPWNPVTRGIVKRCPVDVDAELLTAGEARSLLTSHGFERPRTDYFLYLPEKLFEAFGMIETAFRHLPLGGQYAVLGKLRS